MLLFYEPMVTLLSGLFGVKRYGVHVNGYTVSNSGEMSMCLARRSATKQTYPGMLDHVVSEDGLSLSLSLNVLQLLMLLFSIFIKRRSSGSLKVRFAQM